MQANKPTIFKTLDADKWACVETTRNGSGQTVPRPFAAFYYGDTPQEAYASFLNHNQPKGEQDAGH